MLTVHRQIKLSFEIGSVQKAEPFSFSSIKEILQAAGLFSSFSRESRHRSNPRRPTFRSGDGDNQAGSGV
jgi:hypothetical protein